MQSQLDVITQARPSSDSSELWRSICADPNPHRPPPRMSPSPMEIGVADIASLNEAPQRTLHSAPLVKSSPLSLSLRTMLEDRMFGRPFDAIPLAIDEISDRLPGLRCPSGDVLFLASDRSFEDLNLSVDGLLQHRKKLLASAIDRDRPRRRVFIVGAGPAGLMAAIQLRLRDHEVVVCEQREVYARNRYIGVYKEVTHLMAALGMPERMTYDFSQYRGKRGIMLADIQTLLHGIALKLGAVIYTGAVARSLALETLQHGDVELQRASGSPGAPATSIGMTRWHHDLISHVRSGVTVRFDAVLEASGGRSGLREVLVGRDNVVPLRTVGNAAARRDPSLESCFDDPEDHCAEYVDSGYGCPPGLLPTFASALLSGDEASIPESIPCFVSNIDASILTRPMQQTDGSLGLASRVGDRELAIPHDWVVLECRLSDRSLARYHIEGPLPQSFEFGGTRVDTPSELDRINPVGLLLRILYAMGLPFDAIDRRQLTEFYRTESSYGDVSDIVSMWVGRFQGLRVGQESPIWRGTVRGTDAIEYGVIGEALQNAWYRFGVGVDDALTGAAYFAEGFDQSPGARMESARRLERIMASRSVQILYHLFSVARDTDQGVVGPVLTEYYMDQRRGEDLSEARLREIAREGREMTTVRRDLGGSAATAGLLGAALEYARRSWCQRVLVLLESFAYPREVIERAKHVAAHDPTGWREQIHAMLERILSPAHRTLLLDLFKAADDETAARPVAGERLLELAMGRYAWATPWIRACALRELDSSAPSTATVLSRLAADAQPVVAEAAAAILASAGQNGAPSPLAPVRYSTVDKVVILKNVSLFKAIPDEVLVNVAERLTERAVAPEERIFEKGELGDSLYVIASGRVMVHDGDRVVQILSTGQFFGELSLLDSETRSASASAIETSRLLRLAQDDFYSLINDWPVITRAINQALCDMVRRANERQLRVSERLTLAPT